MAMQETWSQLYLVWQMLNPLRICLYSVLTLWYSQIWLYCSY